MRNTIILLALALTFVSCNKDYDFVNGYEAEDVPVEAVLPNYNFPNIPNVSFDGDLDLGFEITILNDVDLVGTWKKDLSMYGPDQYVLMTFGLDQEWTQTYVNYGEVFYVNHGTVQADVDAGTLQATYYHNDNPQVMYFGTTYSLEDDGQTLIFANEIYTRVQ